MRTATSRISGVSLQNSRDCDSADFKAKALNKASTDHRIPVTFRCSRFLLESDPEGQGLPHSCRGLEPLPESMAVPHLVTGGGRAPGGCSAHETRGRGSAGAYHGGWTEGVRAENNPTGPELRARRWLRFWKPLTTWGEGRGLVAAAGKPALPLRRRACCLTRDNLSTAPRIGARRDPLPHHDC